MRRLYWLIACVEILLAGCSEDAAKHSDAGSRARDAGLDATTPHGLVDASASDAAVTDAATPLPHPVHVEHACSAALHVIVDVLDDASVRVHYVAQAVGAAPERGWLFDLAGFPGPTTSSVQETEDALSITTAAISLHIQGSGCALDLTARDGTVLWQEAAGYTRDAQGRTTLARKLAADERIYGLGEKTGASMRRGRAFEMWNTDAYKAQGYDPTSDPIYQSHPWFVSVQPSGHTMGAYLANANRTTFDIGKTDPAALALGTDAGDMDLFIFDGPAPSAVLERYTRLVGRPALPPRWTLGYHQSRWSYTPAARLEAVGAEFRTRKLPADGLWLDIDYMRGFRDFTWNPDAFPDPAGMLERLAQQGFKVVAIIDPGVKSDANNGYDAYDDGVAKKIFISEGEGSPILRSAWPGLAAFPDFSSASARAWWGEHVGALLASGLRGAWLDVNEPSVDEKAGFPLDAKVDGEGKPTTFLGIKNLYANLEAQASYEGQLAAFPNRRPFVLTRAGFAGIQKYSAVWTGDMLSQWGHLLMVPSILQGLAVSGVPFTGSDVGGFLSGATPELYGRWFELGSLSPFFRSHVVTGAPDQEPWSFGVEIEDVAQRMLANRYALNPYWYESFVAAHESGSLVIRPLWFEFPDDPESGKHEDEFFVGPALLAAPVLAQNVTQRSVYLPAGVFYDFYSGAAYQGPTTLMLPAPLGRTPLFVRAGSVLHQQDVEQFVGASPGAAHYLDVYPGPVGTITSSRLTEDDGETLDYTRGEVSRTDLTLKLEAQGLTFTTSARSAGYTPPVHATTLRVHGIAQAPTGCELDGAAFAFTHDADNRLVSIVLPGFDAPHAIKLSYDATTLAAPRTRDVTFDVTLPDGSPAGDIYLGASIADWKADAFKLVRDGAHAKGTFPLPEGALVRFKVTRGGWDKTEVDAACAIIANRVMVVAGAGNSVKLTVANWGDACH